MGKLLVIVAVIAGCVRSDVVLCGDSLTCPGGTVCADVVNPQLAVPVEHLCVPPEDQEACRDLDAFAECTRKAGDAGRCYDGVCLAAGCGNHRVDPDEVCDDGNSSVGDGCSAGCASNERCGNGIVDPLRLVPVPGAEPVPAVNEICDDGNLVGHDGCDSRCALEAIQWHRLDIGRPRARDNAALAFDTARGRFVLFGGRALGDQGLSDTWESAGGAWIRITQVNAPPSRSGHAMVYDAARRRVVLFGGNGALADTWEWDGVSWTLRLPPTSPPGRSNHAMAYDAKRQRVVLFGGKTGSLSFDGLDDHWEWDGDTWTQIVTTSHPEPRRDHAMAYDPKRGVVVLTGGLDNVTSVPTTWELAGSTWTRMPGTLSSQRMAMTYDPISERVIAYGDASGPLVAATSAYANGQWTNLGATAGPRVGARMVGDAANRRLWMFGGLVPAGGFLDDTWSWNGSSWSEITPAGVPLTPTRLAFRASAYDPIRGELVAYGGRNPTGVVNDETSVFSGTSWKLTSGPPARAGAAMAYDAPGRRMLMMGGGTTVILGDMHTWDGAQWTALPVTTPAPGPRALHAMASDPIRKRIVLFGGTNQTGPNDETWEWDGTTWTQLTPLIRPSPRFAHALSYDPTLARVVLFGGTGSGGQLDDTWAWDGAAWSPIVATNRPVARDGHGAAWDGARGKLTVFGGATTNGPPFDDTIELVDSMWRTLGTQQRPDPRAGCVFTVAADGAAGLMLTAGSSSAARPSGGFAAPASGFSDELWRLRYDGTNPYEICTGSYDNDGDGLIGCADHDCDSRCARCGDGECTALENCRSCAADCACTPECGDFFCDPGETVASCPGDC